MSPDSATGRKSVLIIDDEAHVRRLVERLLQKQGYDAVSVSSAEKGLQQLEKSKPDLIITDMRMPGISGAGFLRKISDPNGQLMYPVLVLTGYTTMEKLFEHVHVAGFMTKPFDNFDLLAEVERIIGSSQAAGGAAAAPTQKRVLLADQDGKTVSSLNDEFVQSGFAVELCDNSSDTIAKALELMPDAIVLKESMPELDGHEIAEILEKIPKTKRIPVVVYSQRKWTLTHDQEVLQRRGNRPVVASNRPADVVDAVRSALR